MRAGSRKRPRTRLRARRLAIARLDHKLIPLLVAAAILATAPSALGHAERRTSLPSYPGVVPKYRSSGPHLVVCASDSRARIRHDLDGRRRRTNLRLLRRCGYRSIQRAVDDAHSGDRILILPGVYREPQSRHEADDDPDCRRYYVITTHGDARVEGVNQFRVASYEYHAHCPNARNLIAIIGDTDRDPQHRCDQRCNLQLEGTGDDPGDVVIKGDKRKIDVLHVDRADGIYLRNFTVQYGVYDGINIIETNGFVVRDVVSRWNQNYGVLTFTDDNGLYDNVTVYGNGHAGVYPGSAAERHHKVPGGAPPPNGLGTTDCTGEHSIEMRRVNSFRNTFGYSGTAGNALWVHHSRFHGNATGMSTDSSASAHPGMPQDCARWEQNRIYSNNLDVFTKGDEEDCTRPFHERANPRFPCPYYFAPVGTGIQIAGGVDNLIADNYIYDNWRNGVRLFWVPATIRLNPDPTELYDTSIANRFVGNHMGVRPNGRPAPNGEDFWWDEAGVANCWSDNLGPGGSAPSSDPGGLQQRYPCPTGNPFLPGNSAKMPEHGACFLYDPLTNQEPVGCGLLTPPPAPAAR